MAVVRVSRDSKQQHPRGDPAVPNCKMHDEASSLLTGSLLLQSTCFVSHLLAMLFQDDERVNGKPSRDKFH
jgi:hypothetical protein